MDLFGKSLPHYIGNYIGIIEALIGKLYIFGSRDILTGKIIVVYWFHVINHDKLISIDFSLFFLEGVNVLER